MKRRCAHPDCYKLFFPKHPEQKYCSIKCRELWNQGLGLGLKEKKEPTTCVKCGNGFTSPNKTLIRICPECKGGDDYQSYADVWGAVI